MQLEGIHHVTAITADAPRNVDFYVRVLGQRMVKKTVNHDQPDVYHLYYGDEHGSPGSAMTFFEFPDAAPGRAGDGMVHTVAWRVGSPAALDFWAERLAAEGVTAEREGDVLRFPDPEGLTLALVVREGLPDRPLAALAPDVPSEHALLGFDGVRAYASDPAASRALLEAGLGFTAAAGGHEAAGSARRGGYAYDPAPAERGVQGAGTVHHVAWAAVNDPELEAWRGRVAAEGARPTPVIDRIYFHSVYFREPSGVLFELATLEPGFAVDEPADALGESLVLPERYEPMRETLERTLTPIVNPRAGAAQG